MAGWTGWEADLLGGLGVPDTAKNRTFLAEWENAEHTSCVHNPLSAHIALSASANCKKLSSGDYAQTYKTQAQGLKATVTQIGQAAYKPIRDALTSGDPFSDKDWQLVVGSLGTWGAHTFAEQYATALAGFGQPGVGTTSAASSSLHAYTHFAKALTHTVPASLYRANKLNRATLARLGR